jgi:hypothetical protein
MMTRAQGGFTTVADSLQVTLESSSEWGKHGNTLRLRCSSWARNKESSKFSRMVVEPWQCKPIHLSFPDLLNIESLEDGRPPDLKHRKSWEWQTAATKVPETCVLPKLPITENLTKRRVAPWQKCNQHLFFPDLLTELKTTNTFCNWCKEKSPVIMAVYTKDYSWSAHMINQTISTLQKLIPAFCVEMLLSYN